MDEAKYHLMMDENGKIIHIRNVFTRLVGTCPECGLELRTNLGRERNPFIRKYFFHPNPNPDFEHEGMSEWHSHWEYEGINQKSDWQKEKILPDESAKSGYRRADLINHRLKLVIEFEATDEPCNDKIYGKIDYWTGKGYKIIFFFDAPLYYKRMGRTHDQKLWNNDNVAVVYNVLYDDDFKHNWFAYPTVVTPERGNTGECGTGYELDLYRKIDEDIVNDNNIWKVLEVLHQKKLDDKETLRYWEEEKKQLELERNKPNEIKRMLGRINNTYLFPPCIHELLNPQKMLMLEGERLDRLTAFLSEFLSKFWARDDALNEVIYASHFIGIDEMTAERIFQHVRDINSHRPCAMIKHIPEKYTDEGYDCLGDFHLCKHQDSICARISYPFRYAELKAEEAYLRSHPKSLTVPNRDY